MTPFWTVKFHSIIVHFLALSSPPTLQELMSNSSHASSVPLLREHCSSTLSPFFMESTLISEHTQGSRRLYNLFPLLISSLEVRLLQWCWCHCTSSTVYFLNHKCSYNNVHYQHCLHEWEWNKGNMGYFWWKHSFSRFTCQFLIFCFDIFPSSPLCFICKFPKVLAVQA